MALAMDVFYGMPYHSCPAPRYLLAGGGIARLARAAEEAGFAGVSFTDHPAPSQAWREAGGHDGVDPFVGLAFAAAATERLRLMTYLVVLPYRNPFHLAKTVASLDALSGGRVELGLGAGYLKTEFRSLGVEWEDRNTLFDEATAVLRAAFTGDPVTYESERFSARGAVTTPACARAGGPPLWIGGNSRRTLRRVVELGAGWLPLTNPRTSGRHLRSRWMESTEDFGGLVDEARAYAAAQGAPLPDRISYPMPGAVDDADMDAHLPLAARARAAGATSLTVSGPAAPDIYSAHEWIVRYGRRVIAQLADRP